jgi:hypothetical protein
LRGSGCIRSKARMKAFGQLRYARTGG